jgi:hypothetical protein
MATLAQSFELPFATLILIGLSYFVAVIAVIIYTKKHIKRFSNMIEDKMDENEHNTPKTR